MLWRDKNNGIILLYFLPGTGYIGLSLSYTILIQQYFDKKRTFAIGISHIGISLGILTLSPLVNFLIETYGWRGCLLIHSSLVLNAIPASMFLKPLTDKRKLRHSARSQEFDSQIKSRESVMTNKSTALVDLSVFKYPKFVLFTITTGLFSFCYMVPAGFLIARVLETDVTSQMASFMMSAWAIGGVIGRMIISIFGDRMDRSLLYGIIVSLAGCATIAVSFVRNYVFNLAYATLWGFLSGKMFLIF